eukprot:TRINITY_DN2949_c1_g1_i1.p1 TRINITY_DN2949_c1_g1~~TRINITY_DN2949_c1_g1_i1.p1  ORF type:complete len:448 (+),score=100.46 TRINITY_DN2949_c1_g1_i1:180-1523(+)
MWCDPAGEFCGLEPTALSHHTWVGVPHRRRSCDSSIPSYYYYYIVKGSKCFKWHSGLFLPRSTKMVVIIQEEDSYSDDEISAPSSSHYGNNSESSPFSVNMSADQFPTTGEDTSKMRNAECDAASETSNDEWHDAVENPDEGNEQRDLSREKTGFETELEKPVSSMASVDDLTVTDVKADAVLPERNGVSREEDGSCCSEKDVETLIAGFASTKIETTTAGEGEGDMSSSQRQSHLGEANPELSASGREDSTDSADALHHNSEDAKSVQEAVEKAEQVKAEGNTLYSGKDYGAALDLYYRALELCPVSDETAQSRAVYHANAAICHLQLGELEESVLQSTKAVELNGGYMKAFMRRAQAHEALHREEDALADYKKVVELDPGNKQAHEAVRRLEPIVAEKREKLKEEMLGKLKDLGNTVLGHFGLSVDNFKAVKDPTSGSYSINFQK